MSALCVIVTGAGSIVGQGIVKALRHSDMLLRIIATDIAPLNAALFRADEAHLMMPVESPDALESIVEVIRPLHADALMIGSEFDLAFFSKHRALIERETGTKVIVSPPETIELADDKFLTATFLKDHGLPFAPAFAASNVDEAARWAAENGYPVVLKARRGTSARHVHIVADESALRALFPSVPLPMVQALAGPINKKDLANEYTCSVFRAADGQILGPFVSRRTLRGGSSWIVEVAPRPEIEPVLQRIGALVPSVGSLNVQLMLSDGRAVPFEFNARFSGTTPIRAYFGFNEPEMALRSFVLGQAIVPPAIRTGTTIRYVEEMFIDGILPDQLGPPFVKGHVLPWF